MNQLARRLRTRVLPNLRHLPGSRLRTCRCCLRPTVYVSFSEGEEFKVCLRCRANHRYEMLSEHLRAACPVTAVTAGYPDALADLAAVAPPGPWLYTGALENYPNLIRQMAVARPFWGNGPNALVACRSPFHVECILREEGLPVPEVRSADAERPWKATIREIRAG